MKKQINIYVSELQKEYHYCLDAGAKRAIARHGRAGGNREAGSAQTAFRLIFHCRFAQLLKSGEKGPGPENAAGAEFLFRLFPGVCLAEHCLYPAR